MNRRQASGIPRLGIHAPGPTLLPFLRFESLFSGRIGEPSEIERVSPCDLLVEADHTENYGIHRNPGTFCICELHSSFP